ncbi:EF-hand domain-containing protein [Rhodopseudomonas sp. NSM]|uniref:EF-hand domain-containing protein n=1 Tax=Rhodopseudomonas sp. NSM TaxID=3457630 RepID=UPI0040371B8F
MKRSTILALGAVAAVVAIGAVAIPAIAGGGPFGNCGPHGFGPMGNWGPGMMHFAQGGWGGRGGFANNPLIKTLDADGDGVVSPEEAKAGTAALLKKHDADGNGTLSKKEFGDMVAEMSRGFAERPFAMLDADNDGQVSVVEINAPAQMMARMHAWRYGASKPDAAPQKP